MRSSIFINKSIDFFVSTMFFSPCNRTFAVRPSSGKLIFFCRLFYFLLIINLCTSSFSGDKNNFNNNNSNNNNNNYFTTHHPLRHHRHHALNRTHINANYNKNHHNSKSTIDTSTTRSPIESVRNFLTSREYDTKRNYYRATTTEKPTTKRPVNLPAGHKSSINIAMKGISQEKEFTRNNRNIDSYHKVKEKTFDEIIREISQFKKRKRFHKTSTTTTTTTEPSLLDDDYDEYDDEYFQDDEGRHDTIDNQFLLPERQKSSEKYIAPKKQDVRQIQNDHPSHNYHAGELTNMKFQNFGTREGVRKQFQMHVESQQVNRKETWDVHYRRNMMESRCKDPKPQVFPSSTDPSRSYVPRCTVLYRCSDDTACCPSADKTCVANTTELIELEFIVTFLNNTNRRLYETFLNHTSCHCVTKPKYSSSLRNVPVSLIQPKRCDCPRIFTEILQENGDCKCECSSHECQVKRKGQEHFSLEERSCISRGLCNKPRCNYGHYVSKEGRCPRLEEKFESRNQQSQSRLY